MVLRENSNSSAATVVLSIAQAKRFSFFPLNIIVQMLQFPIKARFVCLYYLLFVTICSVDYCYMPQVEVSLIQALNSIV